MTALIKYQTRIYFCLVFVLDSLMAEEQNTAVVEEAKDDHQEKKDEVEEPLASKVETPVPEVAKTNTPELTESPELVAAMALQLTTAKTETDTLIGAIREISIKSENVADQESTSQLIKVMLLGLEAQRSISQIGSIEMKQVAVKQLDLLSDQTEILQTLSDDIGANLNRLAQSFVKLSDVIKEGYKQSKDGGTDTEDRHRQMLEKLDSQNVYFLHIRNGINKIVKSCTDLQWTAEELRTGGKEGESGKVSIKGGSLIATVNRNLAELLERYPADLASVADEVTKAVKSLEGVMGTKRPAEGPPNPVPVEPKRVKYQHPETKEEYEGTEAERDQQMASWWAGIAAKSGSAVSRTGILLWSTSAYGPSHGDDSSSFARSDGSSSLKEVEYRFLQMIGD